MFISGYSFNRFITCVLKSFWGYILSNRYVRQHICAYSLLGRTWVLSTQFPLALIYNVAFVENDDSIHVRGVQDCSEGLQYTLSNFPKLDVVADCTVGQFAFWCDCRLSCRTIWTMCPKKQPPTSSILEEYLENYIFWNVLGWNPLLNAVPLSLW